MVDAVLGIIAHDQWVGIQDFRAVGAALVQAFNPCRLALFVTHDEQMIFLLHQKCYHRTRSSQDSHAQSMISVGNGASDRKRVGQLEFPNGVKYVMFYWMSTQTSSMYF